LTGMPQYPEFEKPTAPDAPAGIATLRDRGSAVESGFAVSTVKFTLPIAA
jgi:hypothetical protein